MQCLEDHGKDFKGRVGKSTSVPQKIKKSVFFFGLKTDHCRCFPFNVASLKIRSKLGPLCDTIESWLDLEELARPLRETRVALMRLG